MAPCPLIPRVATPPRAGLPGMASLGLWCVKQGAPHVGFLFTEILPGTTGPRLCLTVHGHWLGEWRQGHQEVDPTLFHFIAAGEFMLHPMIDAAGAAGIIRSFLTDAAAAKGAQPTPHETHKRAPHIALHDQDLAAALALVNWTLLSQISPSSM